MLPPETRETQPGDWIAFQQNSRVVIGRVLYLTKDVLGYTEAVTDISSVDTRYILEVRR